MKLLILVIWDEGQPSIYPFTDEVEAGEAYERSRGMFECFLYVTDDSGHMDLILEDERLPRI